VKRTPFWVSGAPSSRRDSRATDHFGNVLRNIGCQGLVFPSVRSHLLSLYENGVLTNFYGWNLEPVCPSCGYPGDV
jgi:hypothetical protein